MNKPRIAGLALGVGLLAPAVAALIYVFSRDPAKSPVTFCLVRWATGFYCPGCGATRAVYELLHLHPLRALSMNLFLAPFLPALGYMFVAEILRLLAGRYYLPQINPRPWLLIVLGAGLFLFGIARNIPGLEFLQPGGLLN